MDVASPPFLSSSPICFGKSSRLSSPCLIPSFAQKGLRSGCISYKQAALRTSCNATQNRILYAQRKYNDIPWSCLSPKNEFSGQNPVKKFRRMNQGFRYVIVRSDLAGAVTPDSAYPKSELTLGSKIRGICFYAVTAVAAIFFFLLMLVGHPFVLLFDRYRRKFHHLIAKLWATITVSPFFKIDFEGLENVPAADTPAVYVSNHQSFLDIYTLLTLGRSFKFISKTSIFVFPVIGWAMFLMGVIPLKRMDSSSQLECLRRCMDLVKKGASVFFFPEGTRSKDGKLGPFKKGAFSVASKTGVPVVPITLTGTGQIMPAGMEGIVNFGSVKVVVHKPLKGSNADVLCNEARNIIAGALDHQS